MPLLLHRAGITRIRHIHFDGASASLRHAHRLLVAPDAPTFNPIGDAPAKAANDAPALNPEALLAVSSDNRTGRGFNFTSALDLARAFRSGATTPEEIARKILAQVKETRLYSVIKWDEAVRSLNRSLCGGMRGLS